MTSPLADDDGAVPVVASVGRARAPSAGVVLAGLRLVRVVLAPAPRAAEAAVLGVVDVEVDGRRERDEQVAQVRAAADHQREAELVLERRTRKGGK